VPRAAKKSRKEKIRSAESELGIHVSRAVKLNFNLIFDPDVAETVPIDFNLILI
jgi:hypothetical protein